VRLFAALATVALLTTYELVFSCPPADPPASGSGVSPEEAIARLRATAR
jgi:hypothetical protein